MATESKKNPMDRKFQNDSMKVERLTNDDLVCKDCKSKYPDEELTCNTSRCDKFPEHKPFKVIGGGECDEYEKE